MRFQTQLLTRFKVCAAIAAALSILQGCSEGDSVAPKKKTVPGIMSTQVMECGASFSLTIEDNDPMMEPYGEGYSSETLDVCETWVGNDYNVFARVTSSTDNEPDVTDEVQGANYQGGSITPYGEDGAALTEPIQVTSDAFELMQADANTRQASYDDPYYGIRSPDPDPCPPPQVICTILVDPEAKRSAVGVPLPITRRGVRFLVAQTLEGPLGLAGERRFQRKKGETETTYSVDPVTQLLIGQEVVTPTQSLRAKFFWKRVPNGWVRDRSEITSTELIDGKPFTSKSTITVSNFQTNDWGNSK